MPQFLWCGILAGLLTLASSLPHLNRLQARSTQPLRICAFNIKTFGVSKMGKEHIASIITQIVLRYDIILIQEIRDASGDSIRDLWRRVNNTRPYGLALSERLGRSSYKEQYAFYFDLSRVDLLDTHQFDDGPDDYTDWFEREPFSALFRSKASGMEFSLTASHIKPSDAVHEIGYLYDVILDATERKWNEKNNLVLGDLNADCSYAKESDLESLAVYTDTRFEWLIDWDVDTTTSTTDCAYDRFIASGAALKNAIVTNSAGVYHFDDDFGLDYDEAYEVSDHYPIELEIA